MGKLIKYEIKGTYRYILGILALVLILTTGIYLYINNTEDGSPFGAMFIGLSTLVMFGMVLSTFLYIVGSFRKELYENRGYLTFTLPLTGNQIVAAKLIVALMWFTILAITIGLYHTIMALNFIPIELNIQGLLSAIRTIGRLRGQLIVFAISSIISGVNTLILIYLSMALSRVTLRNKKIGGFWFIIFLLLSALITYSQVKISQLLPYYLDLHTFRIGTIDMFNYGFNINIDQSGLMMNGDMGSILVNIGSFIYSILIGLVTFLTTGYLIENKIDL